MVSSKLIAIIPARGGSKRIPKKNILPFKGKPMIAWTIEAALQTGIFKHVLVSTDDEEIRDIALSHGAEAPFLRQDNHDDITPVSEATLDALLQAEEHFNESYDGVIQLMANCPLRGTKTITNMVEEFLNSNANSMISHTRYGWLNPWWACEQDESGTATPLFAEKLKERSQDLPDLYCPTGAIWAAKTNILKQGKTFHTPDKKVFVMDCKEAVDIDDQEDWEMAELAFEMLKKENL